MNTVIRTFAFGLTLVAGISSQPSAASAASPMTAKPKGMVLLPTGEFEMGCRACGLEDALPVHTVTISALWMDETPVTNAEYQVFVKKTGYKTVAERPLLATDFPNVPTKDLVPGSAVFIGPVKVASLDDDLQWWRYVPNASWRKPEGGASTTQKRANHPVVQMAYPDADAYCRANGKRLPTEAEFEYAARGGLQGKKYVWGDTLKPNGRWPANIWQGKFPASNSAEDGYTGTSPVRAFPANGYGLYDMAGNVWEWTSDWYRPDTYKDRATNAKHARHDPKGPDSSYDPNEPDVPKRVQRGGSFLCSDHYCTRYLVGSRGKGAIDSGGSNTGFRCVKALEG